MGFDTSREPSEPATRDLISKMDLREIGCENGEVDGTGSRTCPMADFHISGVEPSGSGTREPLSEADLKGNRL
jgi:hypothetical protein